MPAHAVQIGSSVHILQALNLCNGQGAKCGHAIRQSTIGGPAHVFEQPFGSVPRVFQTDKPISAIKRRSKYRIMIAKRGKRRRNLRRAKSRYICADHAGWSRCRTVYRAGHAGAKITSTLRNPGQIARPDATLQPCAVRRDREYDIPTWITDAAQQRQRLKSKPTRCGSHTDFAPQSSLDPTGTRFFQHDNDSLAHNVSAEVGAQNPRIDALELMNLRYLNTFIDLMHGLSDKAELNHGAMILDEPRV